MSSDSPQSIRPENVDLLNPIPPKASESDFEALVELLGVDSDHEDDAESTAQLGVTKPPGNVIGSDVPNTYSTQNDRLERTLDANRHVDESGLSIDHSCLPSENVGDLIDLFNDSPLWNHASTELPLRELTPSKLHTQVPRSSELTSIKAALDLAHKETEELKKRCHEFESLLPRSRSSEVEADRYPKDKIHYAGASSLSPDNVPKNGHIDDMHGRKAPDIDNMSLPQARILLKFLLRTFSLSISDVQREAQHELQGRSTSYLTPQATLGDIRRSIEFVSYVDELVWRRSRLGCKYDNPYGEDNIQALKDRVDLWEKIIRTTR